MLCQPVLDVFVTMKGKKACMNEEEISRGRAKSYEGMMN
jgi:hypothetical protein